jgi:hypothetical protein
MPIKGPGKFEGETYLVRDLYDKGVDEEIGSSDELGWFGRFAGKIKGRGPFYVIITENSMGFVSGSFYNNEEELEDAWQEIVAEYDEYYGEEGE